MTQTSSQLETARLLLRRPVKGDANAIFERYANVADVTRFLGWPRHRTVDDTLAFLEFSDHAWEHNPAGPYLIFLRSGERLIGGTGLDFVSTDEAMTGYVLAQDVWGLGYATEALAAMIELARRTGVVCLTALCHPEHRASQRVLEKSGFDLGDPPTRRTMFPNLAEGIQQDARCYLRRFDSAEGVRSERQVNP